jgi:predicted acetyltransferase
MSRIDVVPYSAEHREGYARVRSYTYRHGQPISPEEQLIRPGMSGFVAMRDGDYIGAFVVLDMNATRDDALIPLGGVASVAINPEERRGGIGSEMMTRSLWLMREMGLKMASLYAFRESFYRKFGYEVCGKRFKISTAKFPALSSDLKARLLQRECWPEIRPCYERFARRLNGMNIRNELMWSRITGPETPASVYVAGDPVEAYAVIKLNSDFWVEQPVQELVWSTKRGYESILSLLAGLGLNKTAVWWYEPSCSPFMTRFIDRDANIVHEAPIMYRALDVPGMLRALKPRGEGEFTLEIRDEAIPENRGPWKIRWSREGVEVEQNPRADLVMDVRQFVQGYLGEPSFATLGMLDLLEVRSREALEAVERMMPAGTVYCTDIF